MGKSSLIAIVLIGVQTLFSCDKSGQGNNANLGLLQHKWMVVSERGGYPFVSLHAADDEFDPYLGWYSPTSSDYWDFSTNDTLYRSIGNHFDTTVYTMSGDGHRLTLNSFTNAATFSADIRVLTNSRLILSQTPAVNGPIPLLDSLAR